MRLALTADWLTTFGGAEHVIAEFLHLYPDAPLFTTVMKKGALGTHTADIRVSKKLQRWYRLLGNHQILLPWMPRAVEDLDLRGYDVILSSSHAVAKGVVVESSTLHICYCHTPVRYAWEMEEEYLRDFRVPQLLRKTIKRELRTLRRWDLTSAKRVDLYIANSTTTQERIKRIYNRESIVLPPPVDEKFFADGRGQKSEDRQQRVKGGSSPYFLAVCRLVPYKRIDLLIEVANTLKLPLKIAGRGQDEARLRALAGPTVEFLGFVPDEALPSLYANAEALLFPQYEDAGVVLLEAQATGTPVIAFNAGGAKDLVKAGETGLFFDAQTPASLQQALTEFQKLTWDRERIRNHARQFSQTIFREKLKKIIDEAYDRFTKEKFIRT